MIPSLAPEILCKIFDDLDLYGRIRAAQVCSFWRAAGSECARLWQDIVFDGFHVLDTAVLAALLPRTKRMPLTISLHCPDEPDIPLFLKCLEEHMNHIAHLKVRLYLGCWEILNPGFLVPAPILETLSFSGVTDAQIPENLFAGQAPMLRSLDVVGFELPQNCPALSSVLSFATTLDNTNDRVAAQEVRYMYTLLHSLRRISISGLSDYTILPDMPHEFQLDEVELRGMHSVMQTAYLLTPFQISNIRDLTIYCPSAHNILTVMSTSDFPFKSLFISRRKQPFIAYDYDISWEVPTLKYAHLRDCQPRTVIKVLESQHIRTVTFLAIPELLLSMEITFACLVHFIIYMEESDSPDSLEYQDIRMRSGVSLATLEILPQPHWQETRRTTRISYIHRIITKLVPTEALTHCTVRINRVLLTNHEEVAVNATNSRPPCSYEIFS